MKHIYVSRKELQLLLDSLNEEVTDHIPSIIKRDIFGGSLETAYLSSRNIRGMLSKLNRRKAGDETACTIIKNDTEHSRFPCSDQLFVTAIEDDTTPSPAGVRIYHVADAEYYADRSPGKLHPADEEAAA